ncbi:hypothetical protein HMPREF0495_02182 [Levilactobacillus brevis ATCC 14869 = DSM 20054]|uniref:Uncharacterized protein n=1 Tax=Levilactobacillus brevis ATCC 14869 = DSM 20054 TaxID=649758 RepID=U2QJZ4_LEVBR|nr:hypothetical protein HMPREF0495_02182 [Levilactobacillus brevis ATCC 14869 = DSM 20054]
MEASFPGKYPVKETLKAWLSRTERSFMMCYNSGSVDFADTGTLSGRATP